MTRSPKFRSFPFILFVCILVGCVSADPGKASDRELNVEILYPLETTKIEMGQSIKCILKITGEAGEVVPEAQVTVYIFDPNVAASGETEAVFGTGDVYRSEGVLIPHKSSAGKWKIIVEAKTPDGLGEAVLNFTVLSSTSEVLLEKYGFWIEAPTLNGIVPSLVAERGDAANGMIRWGGQIPTQHVFKENWIEIQWRSGEFDLRDPDQARTFLLEDLGDIGFTPIRELGVFESFSFKNWNGWRAKARGQLSYYDIEWIVFNAPEVKKVFAIGTTVVQAPSGIDAHDVLRGNFEIDSKIIPIGEAPAPLTRLLPGPLLVSPSLGMRFFGSEQKIILKWEPVKVLARDEYYQVSVDFNYKEGNSLYKYGTRETQFIIPEWMYATPNCGVFNWRIRLMKQTGTDKAGQPTGEPMSYQSLYWYFEWLYPPGETMSFIKACPNAQY